MIYRVAVRRRFMARHYLIGGNWGSENQIHAHPYEVEVILEGACLDEYGYLVDITKIEASVDEILARIADKTLNDLPEFVGLNPSIERLAEIFCRSLLESLANPPVSTIFVKVFESESSWASCRQELP